jgi:hypothetical protein
LGFGELRAFDDTAGRIAANERPVKVTLVAVALGP